MSISKLFVKAGPSIKAMYVLCAYTLVFGQLCLSQTSAYPGIKWRVLAFNVSFLDFVRLLNSLSVKILCFPSST